MNKTHWAVLVVIGLVGAAGCTGHVTDGTGGTGGGTGAGPSSSSSGSSGTTTGHPVTCPPPEPTNHRPAAAACPTTPSTTACTTDADCAGTPTGPTGKCLAENGGYFCNYDACTSDGDCSNGGVSVCSCQGQTFGYAHQSAGNTCISANCHTDADCGAGLFCSPTVDSGCGSFYGVTGFYCHTCQDTCVNDSDCPATTTTPAGYCAFDPSVGHWACGYGFCAG
jgi:hypothetical protein